MIRLGRTPETNDFGLVVPPAQNDVDYLNCDTTNKKTGGVDRHHLYWPRSLYLTSELPKRFREHRFNSVWLQRSDHDELHHQFDGVEFPPRDVMETFLEEATLLETLDVSVRAVEMIDAAIYEGRIIRLRESQANRNRHLEAIHQTMERTDRLEVVPIAVAQIAIDKALQTIEQQVA